MNKEQQIKEMTQDFKNLGITTRQGIEAFAEILYNAGYRKTFTSDLASDNQKMFKECYIIAKEELLESGELVSKDWHDEQVLHAESEIECLQSEVKVLRSAKDDFKRRFKDSGHRNKKLSLKLRLLKKGIRKAQAEAVKEFAEWIKDHITDVPFCNQKAYNVFCDMVNEKLKEYKQ